MCVRACVCVYVMWLVYTLRVQAMPVREHSSHLPHRTCIKYIEHANSPSLHSLSTAVSQPPSLDRRLSTVSHRVREFDKLPAPEMLRLRAALQCGLLFHELGEEGDRRVSEDIEHRARRALPQLPLLRAFPRLRKEVCRRHGVSYGVRSRTVRVSAEQ